MSDNGKIHQVDQVLPVGKLILLGLQHVLVMYAGAVAVPLIIGGVMNLTREQVALLISADLFSCGIVTLIQSIGIRQFGIRLPVMMGVTFTAVGPMIPIAMNPEMGLAGVFGAVICSGIFGIIIAPFFSRLLPLFPPVVTGTVISVIGISLMGVGINWAAGALPGASGYGAPLHLGIAFMVMALILLIMKYIKGFFANIAVLVGIIAGFIISWVLGKVDFTGLAEAHWISLIYPFQFGLPKFDIVAIFSMCLVMVVTMIESTGIFLALGEMVGKPVSSDSLERGLRTDGLGALIGGVFNTFPHTSFSQNVGLVAVTGVRSRWVTAASGLILIIFGLFPKMGHVVASVPQFVLGGAGIVMFGLVAATGIHILSRIDFEKQGQNLYIVAISIGMGMIPVISDQFFRYLPKTLAPLLHSGILLATLTAVVLNLYFNGLRAEKEIPEQKIDEQIQDNEISCNG